MKCCYNRKVFFHSQKNKGRVIIMKKIAVHKQYKEDWNRVFNHIANLFFEDSQIVVATEDADMWIFFNYTIDNHHSINTESELIVDGQTFTSNYSIRYENSGTDKEQNIRLKRALSHVMLDVLEQYTGMIQQWGILTGVRPTKLYHNFRKQGLSDDEISAILKKDFRI